MAVARMCGWRCWGPAYGLGDGPQSGLRRAAHHGLGSVARSNGAAVRAGALAAASPAEAARDAHVVITMLPTADVVNSVIFAGGVAQALAEGAVWAQMGTIGLAATTGIGSRLGQLRPDVMFVDAPVSGSKGPAEAGQLLILASGPPAAAAAVRPVFLAIGRKTVWLGQAGQGSRMKLVVNAYMSVLIEGVAEALELAGRRPRPGRCQRRPPSPRRPLAPLIRGRSPARAHKPGSSGRRLRPIQSRSHPLRLGSAP
jgi:hypothetical protein